MSCAFAGSAGHSARDTASIDRSCPLMNGLVMQNVTFFGRVRRGGSPAATPADGLQSVPRPCHQDASSSWLVADELGKLYSTTYSSRFFQAPNLCSLRRL